jgi:translation initiation factor IF-2
MSEQKPTRLAKAATYFNVGREEILDYLISKGFSIDNNPNAKIEETMFAALNEKFSSEHDQRAESSLLGKNKEEAEFSSIQSVEVEEKKIIKDDPVVETAKLEAEVEISPTIEEEIIKEEPKLIRMYDMMGRPVYNARENEITIYLYSDGSTRKIIKK